jgi:dTDP-4-amino-4,6-dideoxygalactose transaminase
MNKPTKIPLSRPHLPDLNEYKNLLDKLWETKIISNFGCYAKLMEASASEFLQNEKIAVLSSCDIGLIIGLSVFDLPEGTEVILSPFTFNSTINAVMWNHLTPVFADINKETFCIDPKDVEKKITKKQE